MSHAKRALIVIDLQNDYFPDGSFPLWNADTTLANVEQAIKQAHTHNVPVILLQHIAASKVGAAPFFNQGTIGVELHPRILAAAPDAPIVVKHFADSFFETTLESTLSGLGATELLICGMMTQNCVTHTAISKSAEKYEVTILSDCCTSIDAMVHKLALRAISTRLPLANVSEVWPV